MFLGRLLAITLGVTLLPLRSIYYSAQFALITILFGLSLLIGIPILSGIVFFKSEFSLNFNLLINIFLVMPAVVSLTAIGLSAAAVYLIYATVVDVLTVTWEGLKSGFTDGMPGFWQAFRNQLSYFEGLNLRLEAFLTEIAVEDQINNLEDFTALELVDVVVSGPDLDVSAMQDTTPAAEANWLQSSEIKKAKDLIQTFAALKIPKSVEMKEKVNQLKTRIEQYSELSTRLTLVKEALVKKDLSGVEDQLITLSEITIPIFLVKQYQEKGAWHSVPATGYVSDRDVLLSWLRTKPIHPLNRESLNSPPTYKGMTTRYRWHALSAEHCYAQELGEGAVEIRDLSKKISAQLKSLEEKKPTQGAFSHTFFGAKKLDDLAQVSNDDLTKASDLEAESTVLTA